MAIEYRTQKARGITRISSAAYMLGLHGLNYTVIQSAQDLDTVRVSYPAFARPCPTVPRHGFVDSRKVENAEELRAVWNETIAADPAGELVIMPLIDAVNSAVVTANSISVGPGNDGATSGHKSFEFPMAHISGLDCNAIKQVVKDAVYAEIVSTRNYHYLVQLRDGPACNGHVGNWIPQDTTVANILYATGDLLEFETTAKNAPAGSVLYSPGGNLLSHYCVHARLNKIPVIFSHVPKPGDVLKANTAMMPDYDLSEIKQGIAAGFNVPQSTDVLPDNLRAALVAFHQGALLWRTGRPAFMLGHAIGTVLLAGMLASMGEGRYFLRKLNSAGFQGRDRQYSDLLRRRREARMLLPEIAGMFRQPFRWCPQVGGTAWARCTEQLIKVDRAVQLLSTQAGMVALLGDINNLINMAHNNGRYLNKFLQTADFNAAANGNLSMILDALYGPGSNAVASAEHYPSGVLPQRIKASNRIVTRRVVPYVSEALSAFGVGVDDGTPRVFVKLTPETLEAVKKLPSDDLAGQMRYLKPKISKSAYRWLTDFIHNVAVYAFYGYVDCEWSNRV